MTRRLYRYAALIVFMLLTTACGVADLAFPPDSPARLTDTHTLGDTRIRTSDGMVMLWVPAGEFQMGSNDAQIDLARTLCIQYPDEYGKCISEDFLAESPQRTISVNAFWIDRAEVTNAQYMLCVEVGTCTASRLANQPDYNGDDLPVAGIPWQEASDYCMWAGGRLPTDAEWEYAARGPQALVFPWGNEFDCRGGNLWEGCSGCDDGYPGPSPVGSFPFGDSWCGAQDMAGNVWEWVADPFTIYPEQPQTAPAGGNPSDHRILRGGSWGYCPAFVRSAYRYAVPPEADYLAVGFRCMVPLSD